MQIPSYTIFAGPMFGGKTTKLLAEIDRLNRKRKCVKLFKPVIDNRYDKFFVVTHSGVSHSAIAIKDGTEMLTSIMHDIQLFDVIAVDEAFMIPGCAHVLNYVFSLGKSILVSSLDLSASCDVFTEIARMMPHATKIIKCPAICHECEEDAYYTECCIQKDKEILIGGGDIYRPVCFNHHPKLKEQFASGICGIV